MSTASMLKQALRPIHSRVRAIAARAVLQLLDDSGALQRVQASIRNGERLDSIARIGQFGVASNPPPGSTGVVIAIGGSRTHCVWIGEEHAASRMQVETGEVAIYNQDGDFVHVRQDGTIHVKAASKVLIEAPEAEFTGNVKVDGALQVVGNVQVGGNHAVTGTTTGTGAATFSGGVSDGTGSLGNLRSQYNAHKHGGVQTGSGTTGTTDRAA